MAKLRSSGWFLLVALVLILCGCTVTTIEPTLSPSPIPVTSSTEPVQPSRTPIGTSTQAIEALLKTTTEPSVTPTSIPETSSPAPIHPTRTPIGASPQAAEELSKELPTFTPGPPGVPTLTLTPTIQPGLRAETLPRPLYFLAASRQEGWPNQLWRLDPGASEIVPLTSAEMDVSAAAIWPGDGRLAYGTRASQLFAAWPGESPRLLVDMALPDEEGLRFDNPFVSGLAWSPDGERLAYSVRSYSNIPSPEADGLWLLKVADGTQIKLLDNRYIDRETSDVNDVRIPRPLAWSPDGQALLLRMGYWEYSDMLWMEPLAPSADNSNLHDPEGAWFDGSWSADGSSVWLLGENRNALVTDLAQAGRDKANVTLLLDGDIEGMAFYQAQELPAGLAFLVREAMEREARLHLGRETAAGFTYEAAGPANALCDGELVWDITWDPTGQWAAVTCQEEVKLISLDGGSQEDLTPFLQPLDWPTERSVLFWGS